MGNSNSQRALPTALGWQAGHAPVRRSRGGGWPRRAWALAALAAFFALSGASCPQIVQRYTRPLPRALPAAASLAQVIEVVNGNSQRIQSFSTTRGALSTPGFPSLRASLAFQRAKDFRLRGETALTGPEVDLGSNAQEFWFWIRRAQPPALYYCQHDRYATSSARQIIPVDPNWLIEALGVVTFDPTWQHTGPESVGGGRIQIRSVQPPEAGIDPITRVLVLDELRAIVLEQHLYNSRNQRIATAKLSKHQHDPVQGVTMPRRVEIEWPATQFALTIDLTDLQINQVGGDPGQLFARPRYSGYQDVDLASPEVGPLPASPGMGPPGAGPPGLAPAGAGPPVTWHPVGGAAAEMPPAGIPTAANVSGPAYGNPAAPGYYPAGTYPAGAYPSAAAAPAPAGGDPLAPGYLPASPNTATLPAYAAPRQRPY